LLPQPESLLDAGCVVAGRVAGDARGGKVGRRCCPARAAVLRTVRAGFACGAAAGRRGVAAVGAFTGGAASERSVFGTGGRDARALPPGLWAAACFRLASSSREDWTGGGTVERSASLAGADGSRVTCGSAPDGCSAWVADAPSGAPAQLASSPTQATDRHDLRAARNRRHCLANGLIEVGDRHEVAAEDALI